MATFIRNGAADFSASGRNISEFTAIPSEGLLAYYTFAGGSPADLSGNGETAILHGSPGAGSHGLTLDGVDDFVEFPILGGDTFEWIAMFQPDSPQPAGSSRVFSDASFGVKGTYNQFAAAGGGNANFVGVGFNTLGGNSNTAAYADTQTNWRAMSLARTGATNASVLTLRNLNTGAAVAVNTTGTYLAGGQNILFGNLRNAAGVLLGADFKGKLAAVLIYDNGLSTPNRSKVTAFLESLATGRGLALP